MSDSVAQDAVDDFDPQLKARVRAFQARHGRPLRVLHIGNIANNAFHNATLLHRLDIECDVLCHDYYHIMGCPEWEEADFDNRLADHFRPDWSTQDLHGYQRPPWFAQGPLFLAMDYLIARIEGDLATTNRLWRQLGVLNRTRAPDPVERLRGRAATVAGWTRRGYNVWKHAARLRTYLEDWAQPHRNPGGVWGARAVRLLAPLLLAGAAGWHALGPLRARLRPSSAANRQEQMRAQARATWLCERFHAAFPARADQLTVADIAPWQWTLERWRALFDRYDVVQGFATSAIVPMVAGRPYFAFEHGTLREIPFRTTAEGRLTALAYHLAEHVFVTNADCLPNAHLLADERVSAINHPYDEDVGFPISGWEVLRAELCKELDADFLLFHPTRQDWVPGTGYADKGNDIVFRALAALRAQGLRVGAVCCAWGANVTESQRLATELGLARHVRWVSPLANVRFVRMARACGLVVDQFLLGGFGGVTFKSLAAGVPVCTNLDEAAALHSIGAVPPVLKCGDEATLTSIVAGLYRDPARLAALSDESRAWIKRHHSGREVIETQLRHYLDSVERAGRP